MKKVIIATTVIVSSLAAASAFAGKNWSENRFNRMDLDNNGVISKQEFDQHHEQRFSLLDQNSDGQVTKDEMKAVKKHRRAYRKSKQNRESYGDPES